jgi:hypothetical protein
MIKFRPEGFKDLLLSEMSDEKTSLWVIIRNQVAQPIIDRSNLPISEAYRLLDLYDEKTVEYLLYYLSKELEKIDLSNYIVSDSMEKGKSDEKYI